MAIHSETARVWSLVLTAVTDRSSQEDKQEEESWMDFFQRMMPDEDITKVPPPPCFQVQSAQEMDRQTMIIRLSGYLEQVTSRKQRAERSEARLLNKKKTKLEHMEKQANRLKRKLEEAFDPEQPAMVQEKAEKQHLNCSACYCTVLLCSTAPTVPTHVQDTTVCFYSPLTLSDSFSLTVSHLCCKASLLFKHRCCKTYCSGNFHFSIQYCSR